MSSAQPRSYCPDQPLAGDLRRQLDLLVLRDMMFARKRHFGSCCSPTKRISSNILADRLSRLVEHGLLTKADDPTHKQKAISADREGHRAASGRRADRRLGIALGSRRRSSTRPARKYPARYPRRRPARLGGADGRVARGTPSMKRRFNFLFVIRRLGRFLCGTRTPSSMNRVEKPSRYIGGGPAGLQGPGDRARAHLPGVPGAYEIGMSHLGTKILYGILNNRRGRLRAGVRALDRLRGRAPGARAAAGHAGERPRRSPTFDVIGFSLQYELTYTNVLNMSIWAGLPYARPTRRGRAAGTGRRPDRDPSRAAGAVHRRLLHRRGGREVAAAGAGGGRAARAGVPRRERLIRLGGAIPCTCPSLRDRHRRRDRVPRRRRAGRSARAGSPAARAGRGHQPIPVPRRRRCRTRRQSSIAWRSRWRVAAPRVPLLPGGHDLPPRARARSGGGAGRAGRRA